MNYRALVPVFRAMMTDEARCLCCGHPFDNERDIQIEHNNAPRHRQDFARLHTRNLSIACASCNGAKSKTPYDAWLDQQEEARLSNESYRVAEPECARPALQQLSMFEQAP